MSRGRVISIVFAFALAFSALLVTSNSLTPETTDLSRSVKTSSISAAANLGLYSDNACIQSLTNINWGAISSGDSITKTFYIKNLGKFPLVLSLATANWDPSIANDIMTLNWNCEGLILTVGQVLPMTLTLSASSDASGLTAFSFDIVIYGERSKNIF